MSKRGQKRSLAILKNTPSFNRNAFRSMSDVAKSVGLNSDNLLVVCSWIESKEANERYKLRLVECLIPEKDGGTIPEDVCIKLTYLLKSSKISLIIKVELLKWMVCAHSFMKTNGKFQMLYEIFLGLLKNKEMQPYAAHFLSLITRKKHITLRRVKHVFKIIEESEDHSYYPILHTYFLNASEYFEDEIDERDSFQFESLGVYPSLIKNVHDKYKPNVFSIILSPNIETNSTAALSEYDPINEKSETLSSRLTSFRQLYKQFRALERSNNILMILKSRLRRLFLTSRLQKEIKIKVHDYIIASLHEDSESQDIIEKHLELFRLQHSIPAITDFTEFLIPNNNCDVDVVEVICYEPVSCFKKVQYKLQVIRSKILRTEDVEIKCRWLDILSKMYCFWTLQSKNLIPCDQSCTDSPRSPDSLLCHALSTELYKLGSELCTICDSLIMRNCCPFALNQVLQHYNTVAIACQIKENSVPCFPSPLVYQVSLFSLTPLILETLCEFLLRIKTISELKTGLRIDDMIIFQASCHDIKKLFSGGAYENESTYLAKSKTFKKWNEKCPQYKDGFILHKHPAFLLTIMELKDISSFESVIINPENKQEFCDQLVRNGSSNFIRLFSKIK